MINLFGTDGIRGPVYTYPLIPTALVSLGKAIALWAQEKNYTQPHFLLAHDTRASCTWIKAALKQGLLSCGAYMCDTQILPTPAVVVLMQQQPQFTHGIIISASHNSFEDNGIKIIETSTGKITSQDELRISQLTHDIHTGQLGIPDAQYNNQGQEYSWSQAASVYQNYILNTSNTQAFTGKKIVLDTAHGALFETAPAVFTALGAHVILLHATPDGTNINQNCGAVYPASLQQAIQEHNAHAGFAFDGDGDRIIAVTNTGNIKDGDDILALLLSHPQYNATPALVGTVMSNQALEQYCTQQQKQFIRTAVGDKHVSQVLTTHNLLLGGEPSGHIILKNYIATGDGLLTAVKLIETLLYTGNWDMVTFDKYPQIITNIAVTSKKDLTASPFKELIEQSINKLITGRILVRYSGTEPLLRIMVEEESQEQALSISTLLTRELQNYLN